VTIIIGMNSEITALTELDLTAWLKTVWQALDEEDQGKRKSMLQDANTFLNQDRHHSGGLRQNVSSTPFRPASDFGSPS
jgi:hypothetical protein